MMQIIMLLLLITINNFGQKSNIPNFRNFDWNSSPELIKEKESAKFLQTFNGFGIITHSYRDYLEGLKARVDYVFKDSLLTEGNYLFNSINSFKEDFAKLNSDLKKKLGKPDYWAIKKVSEDYPWIRETNIISFRGPELYWEFEDGFISLQSSKYQEEVTITILYSYGKKISEYRNMDIFSIEY